jgi:hypothetical protein
MPLLLTSLFYIFIGCSTAFANPVFLQKSIEESKEFTVVVDDILGDEDGFDSDPMNVTTHVNCMVWLQWVLSRYYAYLEDTEHVDELQQKYLNQIRYFQAPYTYGNRIHYVDRWIFVANNYLIPNNSCHQNHIKRTTLPLELFFERKGWKGEIYIPKANTIAFPYSTNEAFLECVRTSLPNGYYLVFPVANEEYKKRWDITGDIGLVHSMILEVGKEEYFLWHASIDMENVVSEKPEDFVSRISHLIDGYVVIDILR